MNYLKLNQISPDNNIIYDLNKQGNETNQKNKIYNAPSSVRRSFKYKNCYILNNLNNYHPNVIISNKPNFNKYNINNINNNYVINKNSEIALENNDNNISNNNSDNNNSKKTYEAPSNSHNNNSNNIIHSPISCLNSITLNINNNNYNCYNNNFNEIIEQNNYTQFNGMNGAIELEGNINNKINNLYEVVLLI